MVVVCAALEAKVLRPSSLGRQEGVTSVVASANRGGARISDEARSLAKQLLVLVLKWAEF